MFQMNITNECFVRNWCVAVLLSRPVDSLGSLACLAALTGGGVAVHRAVTTTPPRHSPFPLSFLCFLRFCFFPLSWCVDTKEQHTSLYSRLCT